MCTREEHLNLAAYNESFYLTFALQSSPHKDWAVSGIYYCALHLVEAYLAILNLHPKSNAERNEIFKKHSELDRVYSFFQNLKDCSQNARYYGNQLQPTQIQHLFDFDLHGLREGISSITP